jgi:energy-coupling factor transporter ATP-binding protein EcfA2
MGDDAIENPETDWFDFEAPSSALAKLLYEVSKKSGVCCGIVGPWGSGKTSFMKLMASFLKKEYLTKCALHGSQRGTQEASKILATQWCTILPTVFRKTLKKSRTRLKNSILP